MHEHFLKEKKGAALELAIFYMVFSLLFTTMIVVVSLRLYKSNEAYEKIYDYEISQKALFDQLGDAFFQKVQTHAMSSDIQSAVKNSYEDSTGSDFPYEIVINAYSNYASLKAKNNSVVSSFQSGLLNDGVPSSAISKAYKSAASSLSNYSSANQISFKNTMKDIKNVYEMRITGKDTGEVIFDVVILEGFDFNKESYSDYTLSSSVVKAEYRILNWSKRPLYAHQTGTLVFNGESGFSGGKYADNTSNLSLGLSAAAITAAIVISQ